MGSIVAELRAHPETPPSKVRSIGVEAEWQDPARLWLRYFVDGPVDDLELPDPAASERADDLWRTTCFELFLCKPGESAYCEFNFSPSSRWAAYGFTGERQGMAPLELPKTPEIGLDASAEHLALEATVELPSGLAGQALSAALAAVIEEIDGPKSYWALAHPPGEPDFHHPDCFTLELPPPSSA